MNITKSTRLLVIAPHPDDEALGCGGLIGKVKKEKGEVLIVYSCVGDSRQLVTKQTHKNIRLEEIKQVEKFAKVPTRTLYVGNEFCRLDTVPQKDLTEKIEDIIEEFKPTILAIPSSASYNQDHRATYDACITALRPTPQTTRHFTPIVLECFEPYYWSARQQKHPNVFLDLSEKFGDGNLLDFMIKLYECHTTQVRQDPFPRGVGNLRHLAHVYGREAGIEIAEAYHLLRMVL